MAQTPIVLLATDYLLKGDGLAPSSKVIAALDVAIGKLSADALAALVDPDTGSQPQWAANLSAVAPMVLNNVGTRISDLLSTDEQGIRKFISIFQASSGASGMTTGTIDAAAALKNFKSFSDFGPGINNIQDLVTGGKSGLFSGDSAAMAKIGDSLKGFGSMFNTESLADLGKASSLVQNLGSQGVLPESLQEKITEQGIDLDNPGPADEETLKKLLSEVKGSDLKAIGQITGFPVDKLSNLGDTLDASKLLPANAIPGADAAGALGDLGKKLQTGFGTGNFSSMGSKLSSTKVPELKHLMANPPDFSSVSDSLKSKFSTVSLPAIPANLSSAPAGFTNLLSNARASANQLSIPSIPGHIPNVPSIPGVPSLPLEVPGFAVGGAIDTSMYVKTSNEDLTYTGDDHIVWDRVNTERLNRGLPDLAAIGSPRPEEPAPPPTATPNGTPGVFQMLGTISSQGPIFPHLEYLAGVSVSGGTYESILKALADIQVALDQEQGALNAAGIDLSYPGPTGYMGVTMFAEKLHQIGVDKLNLGIGRFIEELAISADSPGGDSVIAALYEGRNLAA